MNALLDHIDRNLDQTLELASLAERVHFSPFHFHRVFAAWMGETLGDYLRRRRLDVAALMLAAPPHESTVLQIALAVGFGSSEAFSRAFKLRFAQTPSAWRADSPQRWARELAAARERQTQHTPAAAGHIEQSGSVAEQSGSGRQPARRTPCSLLNDGVCDASETDPAAPCAGRLYAPISGRTDRV